MRLEPIITLLCLAPPTAAASLQSLRASRRTVLAGAASPSLANMRAQTANANMLADTSNRAFTFEMQRIQVGAASVPVAIWQPTSSSATGAAAASYDYTINIGRIAKGLRVGWLGWLPESKFALPVGAATPEVLPAEFGRAKPGDAIMFAHGFLGSPFDMAHACEALAADGFTCVAPELPESLSATFAEQAEGLTRDEILNSARKLATDSLGTSGRWGIFGHSAGSGSALKQEGDFVLGRALLCPGFRGYEGKDPLFIVASDGDGCNQFIAKNGVDLRSSLQNDADAGRPTVRFDSAAELFADVKKAPRRGAYIFADSATTEGDKTRLPNHISFLWSEVDEAMASLLSPLVPVAKALGLFMLDFDVYLEARDAEATAAQVVPALRRFFLTFSRA